ncbi:MAG: ABC transporter permease subunit [Actinobacteria bacterium]|uniref:Unannotated protein n=1 Tax=freshwater metagenome TaxID=449393 RepID=A0A6J7DUZ3_9ZZZZ|nr:ABC transporter permease subunit [Actinomycetota bacterium]
MWRIIRSEWVKLRRPAYLWVPLLITTVFTAGLTVANLLNAETTVSNDRNGPPQHLISDYTAAHGATIGIKIGGSLAMIIALVIFAAAVATEYQTGTIRNLLIREPRRVRLMLSRWVGLCTWAIVLVAVTVIAGLVAGVITASSRGFDTSAWFTGPGLRHLGAVTLYLWLGFCLFGSMGAILGILFKSPVAATGVSIAWLLIVENILGTVFPGVKDWLPGNVSGAVYSGGTDTLAFGPALGLITGYLVIAGGATLAWFSRSDITS